jgi:hypothetical protein
MGQGHQGSRYQSQLIANFHSCGARSGKPPQLPGNRTLLICSSVPGADILNGKAGAARRRTGHHDRTSPQGRHRRVAAGQELGGASPHPRAACAIRARGDEKAFRPLEVPASYRSAWPEDVVPGNVARIYARMGWAGTCGMAPIRRPASRMRSRCIGLSRRLREQPKAGAALC